MTIDEVIQELESVAEENQRVVDTGIVFDDVTINMLYCDDTEVIEEHLASYQKYAEKYRQIADWLKELKQLREQTRWIPISERLPKESGNYFTTISFDIGGKEPAREMYKDYFSVLSQKWLYHGEDVIAWMPLHKPYKAESEE